MSTSDLSDLVSERFVLDRPFREGQREGIEAVVKGFQQGYQFVILEAPVGSGKSAIGLTVGEFFDKSFYVTAQKFLQSQIMNDFRDTLDIVDLKGRSNYECTYWLQNEIRLRQTMEPSHLQTMIDEPPDCGMGYCRRRNLSRCQECFDVDSGMIYCPYYQRVDDAQRAKFAVMNYSSFLFQTMIPDRWATRDLLILDEGHQIESQLLDHISISLDSVAMGFPIPELDDAIDYFEFIEQNNIEIRLGDLFKTAMDRKNIKAQDILAGLIKKVHEFVVSVAAGDEWVSEFASEKGVTSVLLKPIYVRHYAKSKIFNMAQNVLIMSATILDAEVFMSSLGINPKLAYCYRMRNRFPVENRPIYYQPVASVTGGKAKQDYWGPIIVNKVDKLVSDYPDCRGIVHTHNFAICNMIKEKSKHTGRMLFQVDFANKEEMLAEHAKRPNTVIVAPAMHEGLDLVNDLSRFQIVCKVPYPNFIDDKQLSRRMDEDRSYYDWLVAIKLCQSVGRSVRHENDWADTYIIDEAFTGFQKRARNMIPNWFHEAITTDAPDDRGRKQPKAERAVS